MYAHFRDIVVRGEGEYVEVYKQHILLARWCPVLAEVRPVVPKDGAEYLYFGEARTEEYWERFAYAVEHHHGVLLNPQFMPEHLRAELPDHSG